MPNTRHRLILALSFFGAAFAADQLLDSRFTDPSDWLSYDRDNSARRFSPLNQIDAGNIARLQVNWAYQFARLPARSENTPLVRHGVMYITVGGEEAHALDARTGREIWSFNYLAPESNSDTASDGVRRRTNWNRGFAISGNRLFMATSDCTLLALDTRSGSLLWSVKLVEGEPAYNTTAAPLVVKNHVMIGVRGGDTGRVRGFIDAFEVETGKRSWRFHTIPAPGETGSETWPKSDVWEGGGGATWTAGSYDPALNLVYWPTGNPGNKDYDGSNRPGDNLYSCSLLALNVDTGKLVWHYQFTPHDTHDWDGNETPVLVDAVWKGRPRKLVIQANRNAFFYVLDRTTGEFLLGEPFAKQTWAKRILPNGRPELMPDIEPTRRGNHVCPDVHGGTNWEAPAYNPLSGLFYVMTRDSCGVYYPTGYVNDAADTVQQSLKAIDIQTGKVKWSVPFLGSQEINHAGAMTTAGNLVFFSTREGQFMAADAHTGKLLWHFNTGGTIRASPMTYAISGKQYITIVSKAAVFTFALSDGS